MRENKAEKTRKSEKQPKNSTHESKSSRKTTNTKIHRGEEKVIQKYCPKFKDTSFQMEGAYKMPSKMEENGPTSRHTVVKYQKSATKKTLQASGKGWGSQSFTQASDFSAAKSEARGQRISVLKF